MTLEVEKDFTMPVREGYWHVDFYTWPNENTKVLVGQCIPYPFWWRTSPWRVRALETCAFQGKLEVETLQRNWYTKEGWIGSDRSLLWRIAIPSGFKDLIVLFTPGRVPLTGEIVENRFEILYTPPQEEKPT